MHREARIMAGLRHPNVIRLYETLKVRLNTFLGRQVPELSIYRRYKVADEMQPDMLRSGKIHFDCFQSLNRIFLYGLCKCRNGNKLYVSQ